MPIENVVLYFGFDRTKPVGSVSIFDKGVEEKLIDELNLVRKGRFKETTKLLVSFEGKITEEGNLQIVGFAFVPDPLPVLPKKD